jgi:hypothetical protein
MIKDVRTSMAADIELMALDQPTSKALDLAQKVMEKGEKENEGTQIWLFFYHATYTQQQPNMIFCRSSIPGSYH